MVGEHYGLLKRYNGKLVVNCWVPRLRVLKLHSYKPEAQASGYFRGFFNPSLARRACIESLARRACIESLVRRACIESLARRACIESLARRACVETLHDLNITTVLLIRMLISISNVLLQNLRVELLFARFVPCV